MHGSGRLRASEFSEQCADGDSFLSIGESGADFCFDGISHDVGHDFGHGVNGSIEPQASSGRLCQIRRALAEKILATSAVSDTGCGKVQSVAVYVYNLVTGGLPNGGVGVGISIVE